MSIVKIAKLANVDLKTISFWIRKHNIPMRTRNEAIHLAEMNHVDLSEEAKEWINGELLGDGSLSSQSLYSAYYSHGSKYQKYCQYISNKFSLFGIQRAGRIYDYHKGNYCTWYYRSLNYPELLSIYKQWYPNHIKQVPYDIKLTPLVCRQWYIGDGCLDHPSQARPYIRLATYSFSMDDVEWLIQQLNLLNIKSTRNKNNTIHISTYSTFDFLNYIGQCPKSIKSIYNYKWDY